MLSARLAAATLAAAGLCALASTAQGCGGDDPAPPGATPDASATPDTGGALDGSLPGEDGGGGADGGADSRPDASSPPPTITPGAKDRIMLSGTVLTPTAVIPEGQVLVEGATITCVAAGTGCNAQPGAVGATVIQTHGVIAPGLIDTHNHILFDIFDDDDWGPAQTYQDHDQWTNEPKYQAMLDVKQCLANDSAGKPAWCASTPYGTAAGSLRCEMDKWGELKGLIAGTTSIVGLPGTGLACFGSLARSIDSPQNGLGTDKVQASALYPPSSPDAICANFATDKTDAFIGHVGEGFNAKAAAEFPALGSMTTPAECLYAPETAITHGCALGPAEFATMGARGMKLVWSPRSNVTLYKKTTDIPAARAAGVTVALGPDWSMGGSQNMLDELRFANDWDDAHFGNILSPKELVTMATENGAKVVGLENKLGKLAPGALADIAVFGGDRASPYDAILAATPREVRLVLVGGVPLYGNAVLEPAAPAAPGCEKLSICGEPKFLCVATTSTSSKLDQTYAQIKAALEQALLDADAQTPADGWSFAPLAPLVRCK